MLSTATPAINSWLNPTSRLMVAVKNLIEGTDFRRVAVIACLMAEALDAQELHLPIQVMHDLFSEVYRYILNL